MNVHPSSIVIKPEPTTAEPFSPSALYELKIDTNGDAVADIAYRVRISRASGGGQAATLLRIEGAQPAETDDGGQIIIDRAPVSTGRDAHITKSGAYRFFAGWRSDPFSFDTLGALNNLQFTGSDFFADKSVCSIVIEAPNSALGSKRIGVWARTLDRVKWKLGPSRARRAASARCLSARLGKRCVSRGGAGGRCTFRCCVCAYA